MKNDKGLHSNRNSKGDRLNWTPMKDVRPVKLSKDMATGKHLDKNDLSYRNNKSNPNNLVP